MKTKALSLKNRLLGSGGTVSGLLGGIGSLSNVCHSLCVSVVSLLAIFGITTQILPLMFLQTYQLYFWSAALVFTALSFYFFLKQKPAIARDRNLLLINAGLLLFGLPFTQVADFQEFFRFIGGSAAIAGVLLFLLEKRLQLVYRSASTIGEVQTMTSVDSTSIQLPRLTTQSLLFIIVVSGFLINQFLMYRMGIFGQMAPPISTTTTSAMKPLSRMKLTPFDVVLAKERMDKNNDGICDVCGMPIQQCIDSGQLDCNMGKNKDAIGILGSQHIHADFKVYINGQALDFAKPEYFMKSSFMHVDNNPNNKEDTSGVLHMHATKVPLWIFFRSLGMSLTKDSFTLTDGRVLKNENGNTLKFYLDGKKVDELEDYVFQELDKLLISYGPENDPDIQKQINSVTSLAKDHKK